MAFDNNQHVLQGIANGAIGAFLFVQHDPSLDDKLLVGTANCRTVGIGPDYSTATGVALPYTSGGVTQLLLGGTVNAGDRIKSDSSGKGVVIAVGGAVQQNVGAIAMRGGLSGDIIPVQVENYVTVAGDYLS